MPSLAFASRCQAILFVAFPPLCIAPLCRAFASPLTASRCVASPLLGSALLYLRIALLRLAPLRLALPLHCCVVLRFAVRFFALSCRCVTTPDAAKLCHCLVIRCILCPSSPSLCAAVLCHSLPLRRCSSPLHCCLLCYLCFALYRVGLRLFSLHFLCVVWQCCSFAPAPFSFAMLCLCRSMLCFTFAASDISSPRLAFARLFFASLCRRFVLSCLALPLLCLYDNACHIVVFAELYDDSYISRLFEPCLKNVWVHRCDRETAFSRSAFSFFLLVFVFRRLAQV